MGFLPTAITHVKQEKTGDSCFGVSWTHDDRILCTTPSGLEIRDPVDLKLQKQHLDNNYRYSSATLCGSKLFITGFSSDFKKHTTFSGSLEQPTRSIFHSQVTVRPVPPTRVAVNKDHLVIIDHTNNLLKFFSTIKEEHRFDIQLPEGLLPHRLHLTSDAALVTFYGEGKLRKYALSPSPDPIWTCEGLEVPSGVTTDVSGCIYVAYLHDPIINIFSPEGQYLLTTQALFNLLRYGLVWVLNLVVAYYEGR
jgi:hypothetical protein